MYFTEIRNMFLTMPSLQNVSRDMNLKFGFICHPFFFYSHSALSTTSLAT